MPIPRLGTTIGMHKIQQQQAKIDDELLTNLVGEQIRLPQLGMGFEGGACVGIFQGELWVAWWSGFGGTGGHGACWLWLHLARSISVPVHAHEERPTSTTAETELSSSSSLCDVTAACSYESPQCHDVLLPDEAKGETMAPYVP